MRYAAVAAGTVAVTVAAAGGLVAWLLHRLDVDLAGNRLT